MRRRTVLTAAGAGLLTAGLAGCASKQRTEPAASARPSASMSADAAARPAGLGGDPLWQVPFEPSPVAVGDRFVGLVDTTKTNRKLTIRAVDPHGASVLSVQVQPMCGAFVVCRTGGRDLLITTDTDLAVGAINDGSARFFVSARDLRSGHRVWGPTRVPGPHKGPGLIFGEFAHSTVSDPQRREPTVAIRPDDGTVAVRSDPETTMLQEQDGILLTADTGGELRAIDTATGRTRWRGADLTVPASARGGRLDASRAIGSSGLECVLAWRVGPGESGLRFAGYELRTGVLLADLGADPNPRALPDAAGGGVAFAARDTVTISQPGGRRATRIPMRRLGSAQPVSLVHGLLYATGEDETLALDTATGRIVGRGPWQPPATATADGLALVAAHADRPPYLAYRLTRTPSPSGSPRR